MKFNSVNRSQRSLFPQTRFSRMVILRHTTQNAQTPVVRQLILFHHFASTFYWAVHQPLCVGIDMFRHLCILIQTCSLDTRENAKDHATDFAHFPLRKCLHALRPCLPEGLSPLTENFRGSSSSILCLRLWSKRGRLCFLSTITSVAETGVSS